MKKGVLFLFFLVLFLSFVSSAEYFETLLNLPIEQDFPDDDGFADPSKILTSFQEDDVIYSLWSRNGHYMKKILLDGYNIQDELGVTLVDNSNLQEVIDAFLTKHSVDLGIIPEEWSVGEIDMEFSNSIQGSSNNPSPNNFGFGVVVLSHEKYGLPVEGDYILFRLKELYNTINNEKEWNIIAVLTNNNGDELYFADGELGDMDLSKEDIARIAQETLIGKIDPQLIVGEVRGTFLYPYYSKPYYYNSYYPNYNWKPYW